MDLLSHYCVPLDSAYMVWCQFHHWKKKHMKLGASLNFKIPSNLDSGKKGTLKYTLSYSMGTDKQFT